MTDERIVEVIRETLDRRLGDDPNHPQDAAEALAALRDAGFDVYRPDDCEKVTICTAEPFEGATVITASWEGPFEDVFERFPQAVVRLVPVGGDS